MSTDWPEKIGRRSPRQEPRVRSARVIPVARPARKRRSQCDVLPKPSRSDVTSLGSIFVETYKIAQCNRIMNDIGFSERITSQLVFQASHKNRKAKRIEARLQ